MVIRTGASHRMQSGVSVKQRLTTVQLLLELAADKFFVDLAAGLSEHQKMKSFDKLAVWLLGVMVCLMVNGCFSCSYHSQQGPNPAPPVGSSSSSSTTSTQATFP